MFAEATGDRQWIHTDPVRAAAGPFGGPIAHGYLTLALAPLVIAEVVEVDHVPAALNYGVNKVRFPAPVPVGGRVRGVVHPGRRRTAARRDRSGVHCGVRTRALRPPGLRRRGRRHLPLSSAACPQPLKSSRSHRQSKEFTMPEAVIVAAARSPIGRAFKGSLTRLRPDDLAATIIRAALDQVPELDLDDIDDLMLGCGLPGGEQGFNMARVVAVLLGMDRVPGTTITRYCASSLQTSRMAMHAIRAGEGDVFISAGVETVSRFAKGSSDSLPDTQNPLFADAQARSAALAAGRAGRLDGPAGRRAAARRLPGDGPDRREPRAGQERHPAGDGRVRGAQPEPGRKGRRRWLLGAGDHPGHPAGRHGHRHRRLPASRRHPRRGRRPQAGVPAGRPGHRRQRLPVERRRGRPGDHERHQGPRPRA